MAAVSRLGKELRDVQRCAAADGFSDGIFLGLLSETNMFLWEAYIQGPPGTPFEGGTYRLLLNVPPEYPMLPPSATFTTPVFHPNVNFHSGAVCLDILKTKWSPAWTLSSVCRAVWSLLAEPEASSPLNCDAGNLLRAGDVEGYNSLVRMYAICAAGAPPFPADVDTDADAEQVISSFNGAFIGDVKLAVELGKPRDRQDQGQFVPKRPRDRSGSRERYGHHPDDDRRERGWGRGRESTFNTNGDYFNSSVGNGSSDVFTLFVGLGPYGRSISDAELISRVEEVAPLVALRRRGMSVFMDVRNRDDGLRVIKHLNGQYIREARVTVQQSIEKRPDGQGYGDRDAMPRDDRRDDRYDYRRDDTRVEHRDDYRDKDRSRHSRRDDSRDGHRSRGSRSHRRHRDRSSSASSRRRASSSDSRSSRSSGSSGHGKYRRHRSSRHESRRDRSDRRTKDRAEGTSRSGRGAEGQRADNGSRKHRDGGKSRSPSRSASRSRSPRSRSGSGRRSGSRASSISQH